MAERKHCMSNEKCTLTHLEAAAKAANRAYRKNGPKSYRKGQGALLKVLHKAGGSADRDELIDRLGFDRRELKHVVRKAQRNGYVAMENLDGKGYKVTLSSEGDALAEKRCAAQAKAAKEILSCLSEEEVAQLDSLLVKIADSCGKGKGSCKKGSCSKHRKSSHGKRCHHRH